MSSSLKGSKTRFGQYRILELAGEGSIGFVYKARDEVLGRPVALKVLSREWSHLADVRKRFRREAKLIASIHHPSVAQIYNYGEEANEFYLVLEWCPGGSVESTLAEMKKMEPLRAIDIILQSAEGLESARKKGIFHRDVMPANLLFDANGHVKIVDFSIGVRKQTSERGPIKGHPPYIAPERAIGKPSDHRADIYSLGITFYVLLYGRFPYAASSPREWMAKNTKEPFPSHEVSGNHIPYPIYRVMEKMTQKDPARRYQNYTVLIEDLSKLRSYLSIPQLWSSQLEKARMAGKKKLEIAKRSQIHDPAFALALCGGESILASRTETTMGTRFPADPYPGTKEIRYEHKLYDGAAGIGITLLDLFRATGDSRYRVLCDEISHGLIQSTPELGALPEGLYSGFGGVALFQLARARVLQDANALEVAIQMGTRVGNAEFVDTDLMAGAAGRGLLQLALYHSTRDTRFLDAALDSASFLAECGTVAGEGIAWYGRDPRQPLTGKEHEWYVEIAMQIHSGLAHGVAGVALFLTELTAITSNRDVSALRDKAFHWLSANAIRLENGLIWMRSETERTIQDHWCHGSAGTAHAYLALYRTTGEKHAMQYAEAAALSTWNACQRDPAEPTCHCHGMAGAIELFLELDRHGAGEIWKKRAWALARQIQDRVTKTERRTLKNLLPNTLGGKGSGLSVGTAGVVRELLRLAGHPVFPILQPIREPIVVRQRFTARNSKATPVSSPRFAASDELLPRLAVRFPDCERYVVAGAPKRKTAHRILEMIAHSEAGDAYFRALDLVNQSCERLRRQYTHVLAPDSLNAESFGILLREIGTMTLRPDANPPVVRRAAKRTTANTLQAIHLMFQRLKTDLSGSLLGEVSGRIADVRLRSSDPHRGGQRVLELRFEDGTALLYKARPLLLDREFAGISTGEEPATIAHLCRTWLEPAIPGGQLPLHRLIAAGPWHGYVEAISADPNSSFDFENTPTDASPPRVLRLKTGDDQRYWYSAGLLAGYAFSFGIHDLHSENIISGVSRSTPDISMHAVDLEMAFGRVIDLEDTHLINGPRWDGSPQPHTHSPLDFVPDPYCALYSEDWAIEKRTGQLQWIPRPFVTAYWRFPHLVQNSDGTFGYTNNICAFLRGFADQWSVIQEHAAEIATHLRQRLSGAPMRVVFKPTRSQVPALMKRKMDGLPLIGLAINPAFPAALPYVESELRQLENLDIPYFFRVLKEEQEAKAMIYCFEYGEVHSVMDASMPPIEEGYPFWKIVEQQSDLNYVARAVVDIAWAIAPSGCFDFHDPSLGIRIVRTQEDERMLIIVLLGTQRDKRLTCRVASEGIIDWWLD